VVAGSRRGSSGGEGPIQGARPPPISIFESHGAKHDSQIRFFLTQDVIASPDGFESVGVGTLGMSVSEEVSRLRIQVQELEGEEKMMLRELETQASALQKAQAEATRFKKAAERAMQGEREALAVNKDLTSQLSQAQAVLASCLCPSWSSSTYPQHLIVWISVARRVHLQVMLRDMEASLESQAALSPRSASRAVVAEHQDFVLYDLEPPGTEHRDPSASFKARAYGAGRGVHPELEMLHRELQRS